MSAARMRMGSLESEASKAAAEPWNSALTLAGGAARSALVNAWLTVDGVADGFAGGEVEGDGDGRELALMVDGERARTALKVGEGGERDLGAVGALDVDVDRARRGERWKRGATSRTTWYWFCWVNMVETWRWPKASSRVSSMFCGVMPRREAVSRSMTRWALEAAELLIAGDVGQDVKLCLLELGDHLVGPERELGGVGVLDRVLVLGAGDAVFYGEVLQGCRKV